LFEQDGKPAVWVFDRATATVALQPVTVLRYESGAVLLSSGLNQGDIVVTAGVHVLRPGQKVRLLAEVVR
jgi:multidrug efflux pump subunit AcrA (membrane-fusion protein)